jgi:hypothetical protein
VLAFGFDRLDLARYALGGVWTCACEAGIVVVAAEEEEARHEPVPCLQVEGPALAHCTCRAQTTNRDGPDIVLMRAKGAGRSDLKQVSYIN